jgi:hypothetical protein
MTVAMAKAPRRQPVRAVPITIRSTGKARDRRETAFLPRVDAARLEANLVLRGCVADDRDPVDDRLETRRRHELQVGEVDDDLVDGVRHRRAVNSSPEPLEMSDRRPFRGAGEPNGEGSRATRRIARQLGGAEIRGEGHGVAAS